MRPQVGLVHCLTMVTKVSGRTREVSGVGGQAIQVVRGLETGVSQPNGQRREYIYIGTSHIGKHGSKKVGHITKTFVNKYNTQQIA